MSKSYCTKCRKEVSEDTEQCECGNKAFVFGEKFHFEEKGIVCNCGNNNFKTVMNMDCTNKAVNNYACTKCGNPIGIEIYRSEEERMMWEDN